MTEKFTILKLRLEADKMLILAGFILFTLFLTAGFSVLPIKTSADSNSLNIYKTARNITNQESNWKKTTSANSGDRLAFQLQISTNNNTTANNAVVTDNLPSQLSYASGSTRIDGNYTASDNIISNGLFIGTISPGQTKIITFEATTVSGYSYSYNNTLTNYAYVKADNVSQQSDSAQVFINSNYQPYGQTYLTLRKTAQNTNNPNGNETDNTAMPGDTLRYTFYYTNPGNTAVYNLRIIDDLPPYLSIVSADNGGIYDERTNQTAWNIGTMSADGLRSGSVSYIVKVNNPPSSTIIRNTGIIRADNLPDATSNEVRTTIGTIAAPAYQVPAQAQVVRAVTGANDILADSAAAAAAGGLTVIVLYLITQNFGWFTKTKLRLKILANRFSY